MVKSADVMRDRHLDQMIMCCIYVLAKVTGVSVFRTQACVSVFRTIILDRLVRLYSIPSY